MKFVSLYSTIKMMHGPINIRFTYFRVISVHLCGGRANWMARKCSYSQDLNWGTSGKEKVLTIWL